MNFCYRTVLTLLASSAIGLSQSSWVQSARVDELRDKLGAAAPDGSGVRVVQSEAQGFEGASAFYPQAGSGTFAGQNLGNQGSITRNYLGVNFTAQSGGQDTAQHAQQVARRFYERTEGIAPGITEVSLYNASGYIDWQGSRIADDEGRVHNSSWIAGGNIQGFIDNADQAALDRGFIHCIGLNNGTGAIPGLFGHCYNTIAVGRKDGFHSRGTTTSDFTGEGRMKPDIVGFSNATSFATPEVSAVSALLYQTVDENSSLSAANDPNVIRAIILAGADKDFNANWAREDSTQPYDPIFGAGLLDAYRSYEILSGGSNPPSETDFQPTHGWAALNSLETRRFLFEVPERSFGDQFSVVLSWFRAQDGRDGLRNSLDLILQKKNDQGQWIEFERSDSSVDNVEHLFQRNLSPGEYRLEIPAVTYEEGVFFTTTRGFDFSLAWRLELGIGPKLEVTADGDLMAKNLDPRASYTIESSSALDATTWQQAASLPAGARRDALVDIPSSSGTPVFYRIRWSAPPSLP